MVANHVGERRTKNWFEPIYDPQLPPLVRGDWKFDTITGRSKCFMHAEDMTTVLVPGEVKEFRRLTFNTCDFQGDFRHIPSLLFDNCVFIKCDFAFSFWYRSTFRKCHFERTSLSLATFEECEFRDCKWQKIGYSASKTRIIRTFINTPTQFISQSFSGCNPALVDNGEHKAYQAFRLEERKAHMARNLLTSHEDVGDDETFYETAKSHDLQQVLFRISQDRFIIMYSTEIKLRLYAVSSLMLDLPELCILWLAGSSNKWGARFFRPLFLLCFSYVTFSFIYRLLGHGIVHSWQTSFDITLIAGYTNASSLSLSLDKRLHLLEDLQLVISIFLYTVFFSTAISRLSRSR